jgi:hypothetical protein
MKRIVMPAVALCAGMFAAAAQAAEQDAASQAAPGQVALTYDFSGVLPADKARMTASAKAAAAVVLATPALTDPRGVAVNGGVHGGQTGRGLSKSGPYAAFGVIILRRIRLDLKRKADAQGRFEGEGEGPTIHLVLNNLNFLTGNGPPPAADEIYVLPNTVRWDRGVMPVRSGDWDVLVVGRPDRAPFVHLTRREILESAVARMQPSPGLDDVRAGRLAAKRDEYVRELARLSPAQLAEPGCEHGFLDKKLSKSGCETPGANFLVRYNLDYFDPAKPRTALQIIALQVRRRGPGSDAMLTDRLRTAAGQVDLAALRRLVQ